MAVHIELVPFTAYDGVNNTARMDSDAHVDDLPLKIGIRCFMPPSTFQSDVIFLTEN